MNNTLKKRMHVGLSVSNIANTIDFYQKIFNQKVDKQKGDYAKFELPELVISFIETNKVPNQQFGHFGFQLESSAQVKELLETVKTMNINTLEEEQVKCCYALQDKFWVADPDGYRWEFYYMEADIESNDPFSDGCCTTNSSKTEESCCTTEDKAQAASCC